jgi:hypothetical protein
MKMNPKFMITLTQNVLENNFFIVPGYLKCNGKLKKEKVLK